MSTFTDAEIKKAGELTFEAPDTDDFMKIELPKAMTAINAGGGGGGIASVVAGTGVSVDDTDPANPIVALDEGTETALALAASALQSIPAMALHSAIAVTDLVATLPGPLHGLGYIGSAAGTYFLCSAGSESAAGVGGPGFCSYNATAHTLTFATGDTVATVDVLMA